MDTYWNEHLEARIARLLSAGERVVLVTVIARTGSTPRGAGTRALQTESGFEGTVGGGLLEAQSMQAAAQALASGQSCRASFNLAGHITANSDLICGGGMEVLCEVLSPEQAPMFALADDILNHDGHAIWTVALNGNDKVVHIERRLHVSAADWLPTALPARASVGLEPALDMLGGRKLRACLVQDKGRDVYVEPLDAPPVLLLVGGGHVSLAVAQLAHACDFVVDVVDDREEFANSERFPMARRCVVLPQFANLATACGIGPRHHVAILTRGHAFDRETLAQALPAKPRYLGMIGSRTKRDQIYEHLRQQGVSEAELARVRCPIGLGIAAETPQQIAVSVVAELLAERRGTLDVLRSASCRQS